MNYTMKEVSIKPVINGFIVKVGCIEVVFDNTKKMLKALEKYINTPKSVEKTYLNNPLNETNELYGQPITSTQGFVIGGNATNTTQ